jgi:hypothetical protein
LGADPQHPRHRSRYRLLDLGLLNKPKAETVFEQVSHYVQIAAGLGTKPAGDKSCRSL